MWTSTSGWVAERVDRGGKRGPVKGGVARRMGRYVCRERTTDRAAILESMSIKRKEGTSAQLGGGRGVPSPAMCVRASTYTPFFPSASRVPSHAAFAVDPPSRYTSYARERMEKQT